MNAASDFIWGHALGWPAKFLEADPDPLLAKLKFLTQHGLHSTDVSLKECTALDAPTRSKVASLMAEGELRLTIVPEFNFFGAAPEVLQKEVDAALSALALISKTLPIGLLALSAGKVHRFLREPDLRTQMDMLHRVLLPFGRGCHELGLQLAIENHADYYVTDLVDLCRQTPHLGVFFDTGNCFLMGEKPLAAALEAAPYVVGGHFKDQRVRPRPDASPLCFEVGNAMPGEGDVPLREIYAILRDKAPKTKPLVLEIEAFPAKWNDPLPEFERALSFIRSLR